MSEAPGEDQEEGANQEQAPTTQDEPLKNTERVGTFYVLET